MSHSVSHSVSDYTPVRMNGWKTTVKKSTDFLFLFSFVIFGFFNNLN
jgi:hypothetical protein